MTDLQFVALIAINIILFVSQSFQLDYKIKRLRRDLGLKDDKEMTDRRRGVFSLLQARTSFTVKGKQMKYAWIVTVLTLSSPIAHAQDDTGAQRAAMPARRGSPNVAPVTDPNAFTGLSSCPEGQTPGYIGTKIYRCTENLYQHHANGDKAPQGSAQH